MWQEQLCVHDAATYVIDPFSDVEQAKHSRAHDEVQAVPTIIDLLAEREEGLVDISASLFKLLRQYYV